MHPHFSRLFAAPGRAREKHEKMPMDFVLILKPSSSVRAWVWPLDTIDGEVRLIKSLNMYIVMRCNVG